MRLVPLAVVFAVGCRHGADVVPTETRDRFLDAFDDLRRWAVAEGQAIADLPRTSEGDAEAVRRTDRLRSLSRRADDARRDFDLSVASDDASGAADAAAEMRRIANDARGGR